MPILLPDYVHALAGAVLGLIIGSFLTTIASRWPSGQSVMAGRSRCDHCEAQLSARDLIPVVSYILQQGKCRHCGRRISSDYVAIELAAALIGALAFFIAPGWTGLSGAIFGWLLIVLAALDAQHHWLPNRLTAGLALSGLVTGLIAHGPAIPDRVIGGIAGFAALMLIAFIYRQVRGREGLGGGDPKMLGAIGCWLGWQALPLVLLGASLVGLVAVAGLWQRQEEVNAQTALPLGSFMAVAAFPIWLLQAAFHRGAEIGPLLGGFTG